jgi:hypothetical protein
MAYQYTHETPNHQKKSLKILQAGWHRHPLIIPLVPVAELDISFTG